MKLSFLSAVILNLYLRLDMFTEALRCYSCSITAANTDMRCLNDPVSVEGQSVVNCNKKYCTILRQELMDPPGKINTFVRGCEEKPILLDEVIEDPNFKTYYRSCSEDLCNSGDALKSQTEQKISPDGYDGENLLVPGLPLNKSKFITGSLKCVLFGLILSCFVVK